MTEKCTPEKVAELVAHLRKKRAFFEKFSSDTENETMILLRSSADALTAVSAERDAEHRRAEGSRQAFLNTSKDRFRIKDERDRLHKAITEALAVQFDRNLQPHRAWPRYQDDVDRILRAALDKEGNDDE